MASTYYVHDDNDCNLTGEYENAGAAIDALVESYGGEVSEDHKHALTITVFAKDQQGDDYASRTVIVASEGCQD